MLSLWETIWGKDGIGSDLSALIKQTVTSVMLSKVAVISHIIVSSAGSSSGIKVSRVRVSSWFPSSVNIDVSTGSF
jgi:hypothetical protein